MQTDRGKLGHGRCLLRNFPSDAHVAAVTAEAAIDQRNMKLYAVHGN